MASNTRLRDRIFAGAGAALFLVGACAATIYYIVEDPGSSTSAASQTQTASCDISTPVSDQAMTAPEVYKPAGTVTELKTTDLKVGTGATAKNGDCLVMKYQGNLATDGTVFDENYSKTQALQFTLGAGQVIQGWDQGLAGMKVGGVRRLEIPAALGYGSTAQASIPANSDLVFTVTLEKIKKD